MSAIDTPPTQSHHLHFDRLPSKRKLDDYDHFSVDCNGGDDFPRFRKNSGSSCSNSNSKGKSILDPQSSSLRNLNLLLGESSSSRPRLQLQFFVRMISGGKTLVLQANLNDTVEMVHQKIQSITGIPVMEQRLIYRGKQLQWEQTLEECSVQNDAGLQLVGRMRSTDHPRAWRVINDMVSIICRLCRKEYPNFNSGVVKGKLEQYMALPLDRPNNPASLLTRTRNDRKKGSNKKKELVSDDDDEEEEEDDTVAADHINKIDYCKIFLDACAPQALVMLYLSSEKRNKDCAEDCIRSFVSSVKDLVGTTVERACCATIVLEFCRLLRMTAADDNELYLHCRSTLGSMLERVELASEAKEMYNCSNGGGNTCIAVQDVFPFLKELGQRIVKDLVQSVESNAGSGPSSRDVCDFSAFLQPVLSVIHRRLTVATVNHKSKGRATPLFQEVEHLLYLFNELLIWTERCLKNMELCLAMKRKKDVEVYRSGWSQYLAILNEMSSISVLYPGSEHQFWTMMGQNKLAVRGLVIRYAKRTDDHSWLLKHKDILDFESRRHLAMLMFPELREDYEELHEMLIDRSQLLAESFEYISRAQPSSLHAGLFMEFKNEEATGPGVLREWFCLVCQAIFDPQNALFVACPLDLRRFFPNPASKVDPLHLRYFHFSGRVIGLALMHKIQVGVVLDRVFFLQLAGRNVSVEDIQDADPCIYNSCKQILEMDPEFVDSDGLGLTFVTEVEELGSRKTVELCAGGKGIVVNSQNRREYVNLIVQHHFVTSITEQVSSFAQGFSDILHDGKLRATFFESLELEDLDWMLRGSENEICADDWKAHTEYNGYKKSDPQIVWFWEVVGQLNAEQKKTLLFFWTSVKYLPVEGFRGLASRLYLYKSLEAPDRLPSSHTCFYRLCIPPYPSKAVMQERILVITQEHVGCSFGTW